LTEDQNKSFRLVNTDMKRLDHRWIGARQDETLNQTKHFKKAKQRKFKSIFI